MGDIEGSWFRLNYGGCPLSMNEYLSWEMDRIIKINAYFDRQKDYEEQEAKKNR